MEAPIITLTTDWGNKDYFAGIVKGKLYSSIPNLRVVDISHGIEPYNLFSAAFVVKHGCLGFPPGTIHIIDVDSVETADRSFIVAEYMQQYFICTDNGLPDIVFGGQCTRIVELSVPQESNFYTFAAYHLFCNVATLIAQGTPLEQLGRTKQQLNPNTKVGYLEQGNRLVAYIIHIDSYGNAYLNITLDEFEAIRAGRNFTVNIHNSNNERIHRISDSYLSITPDNQHTGLILTVSATGLLEIAICHDSAEQYLALSEMKKIEFLFA